MLDLHSVAACCRLCDAWTTIGESLQPQPDLVSRLDQIFGVESSEDRARRLADGEAALNVAAAPFPAIDDAFAEAMRARDAASFLDPGCSPQALRRALGRNVKYP